MHAPYAPGALEAFAQCLLEKNAGVSINLGGVARGAARVGGYSSAAGVPQVAAHLAPVSAVAPVAAPAARVARRAPAARPAERNTGGFFGNTFSSAPVNTTTRAQHRQSTAQGKQLWNDVGTPGGNQGGFSNLWDVGKGVQRSYNQASEAGKGMWDSVQGAATAGQNMIRALHPDQVRSMRNAGLATGAAGLAGLGAVGSFVF